MPLYVQTDATGALPSSPNVLLPNPQIGVTPEGAIKVSSNPSPATAWGTDSVSTAGTGTNFTALPSHDAAAVLIVNPSVALDVRKVGASAFVTMAAGTGLEIPVVANSNEIEVRRNDVSNSQISVKFVYAL